jgi:hypothetical protein
MDLRKIAPSIKVSQYGRRIVEETPYVTDGLVLFLDASNPLSYPGSGGTWFDISGNNRNYSIGSSISWNSAGYFSVSGGTFTGPASNSFGFLSTNEHYIEVVARPTLSNTNTFFRWEATPSVGTDVRSISTHWPWLSNTVFYDVSGCCDAQQRISYVDNSLVNNTVHYSWRTRRSSTPNRELFKNNVRMFDSGSNNTASVTYNRTNAATIGGSWNGLLYSFRVYNRDLSDEEKTKNYLYDKQRFNI